MIQKPLFAPQTEWIPPHDFPDLSNYPEISIDLETKIQTLKLWVQVLLQAEVKL